MLGDSKEDVGFDTSQKPASCATIADRAVLSFPWIAELHIVRAWAALRVMPPDGLPIYDQSERFPGAFTANCHSGVTLAGAHANAVRADGRRGRARPDARPRSRRGASMFRLRPDAPRRRSRSSSRAAGPVPPGASAAAAVLLAGLASDPRDPVSGSERAPYCMMGVCFDCLAEIDGVPTARAAWSTVAPACASAASAARAHARIRRHPAR